jgi:hypothetical protein
MEFLNLEEEKTDAKMLAGWDEFFHGETGGKAGVPLQRGFFNYYPVEKAKIGAREIATFSDPRARLQDLKEQPYIVSHSPGAGKVVWIGSGETWRLRQYREAYHERFWTKLCRFVSSGSTGKINKRILPRVGKEHAVNTYVSVEAQLYGRDMNVLPATSKPKLRVKPPVGAAEKETEVVMTPRPGGDWNGVFTTRVLVKSPGEYNLEFKVDETGDTAPGKFNVKEVNPETDNTRPDVDRLYWLASDASKVMKRVDEATQKELRGGWCVRGCAIRTRRAGRQPRPGQGRAATLLRSAKCGIDPIVHDHGAEGTAQPWGRPGLWDKDFGLFEFFGLGKAQARRRLDDDGAAVAGDRTGHRLRRAEHRVPGAVGRRAGHRTGQLHPAGRRGPGSSRRIVDLLPLVSDRVCGERQPRLRQAALLSIGLLSVVGLLSLEWFIRKMLRLA